MGTGSEIIHAINEMPPPTTSTVTAVPAAVPIASETQRVASRRSKTASAAATQQQCGREADQTKQHGVADPGAGLHQHEVADHRQQRPERKRGDDEPAIHPHAGIMPSRRKSLHFVPK